MQNSNLAKDEYFLISEEGLLSLRNCYDPSDKDRNICWTTDINAELPIRMKQTGLGALKPTTLIQAWHTALKKIWQRPSIHYKKPGEQDYSVQTFQEYYETSRKFGRALIKWGISERAGINITGFNHPVWMWGFHGAIFANCIPVGVYQTNQQDICQWIANDCSAEIVIVENQKYLDKYLQIWDNCPKVKQILIYNDQHIKWNKIPQNRRGQVMYFEDFLKGGESLEFDKELSRRMDKQKPGNCCNIVYTSGTTGTPKGAMISHDNSTWISQCAFKWFNLNENTRFISYLPLSHIAAQMIDIFATVQSGAQVFLGDENALKGTLVQTLKDGLPTFFMGVPRVFEKIEEKFRSQSKDNSWLKKMIVSWAKSGTFEGTFIEQATPEKTPFSLQLKKVVLLNQIKKLVGLNEANDLIIGAGACSSSTRRFFMELNLPLTACFGMSELTGPVAFTDFSKFKEPNQQFLQACGQVFEGVHVKIVDGEILFKCRNRFMGYLNNEKETRNTIDSEGYLHSGDVGFLDEQNNLTITGRKKEILKTAGGENIAPAPIETLLKEQIPMLSNVVLIGDQRKFLTAILTFATEENSFRLLPEVLQALKEINIQNIQTIADAKTDGKFMNYIQQNINIINSKAISRAATIKKWVILDHDFSVDAGELTPTMKVKRNFVYKKYNAIIEQLYSVPNL